jgi:MSHA biogenesis protein MshQ
MTYTFPAADRFVYDKNSNAAVTPFPGDLDISIDSVSDGEASAGVLLPVEPTGVNLRYGRWFMQNAYGPEIMPLAMRAEVQYLNNSNTWVINPDDGCTVLPVLTTSSGTASVGRIDDITVGSGTSDFTYNGTLSGGAAAFTFTAPGTENTGSIPISVDLGALDWLRFDWDGDNALDAHPDVQATFGQYRGHDRIIYWQEVEQ